MSLTRVRRAAVVLVGRCRALLRGGTATVDGGPPSLSDDIVRLHPR